MEDPKYQDFHKKEKINNAMKSIVWIIVLSAAVYGLWMKTKAVPEETPIKLIPQVAQTETSSENMLSNRVMPEKIAIQISSIDLYSDELNLIQKQVSEFHKQSWGTRNINDYQAALVEAVEKSDKYLNYLKTLKVDPELQILWQAKYDSVINLKTADQYFLDYIHTKRISDNEMGNHYLNLLRKNNYIESLVEYLKQHNYRYALDQNGGIRYWYSKNGF